MRTDCTAQDRAYLRRALQLALQAEAGGNLPIGAVVVLGGAIVGEGHNHIWVPVLASTRHAEMEALRAVPPQLWPRAKEMTLYTTLEPCVMCAGAILLHHIGRVVFGASDGYGGIGAGVAHGPPYFREAYAATHWEGPAWPEECDPLATRVLALVAAHETPGSAKE